MQPAVRAALEELGIEDESETLARHAHVEIALAPGGTGRTRIGGAALLTPDAWPVHRWSRAEVDGWPDYAQADLARARAEGKVREEAAGFVMPLSFLCQVDLAEARAQELPERGLLLFFASVVTDVPDPLFGKRVASAVVYVETPPEVGTPQPKTADPIPESVIPLRPERRVYFELPWEDLERIQAKVSAAARPRFDALCTQCDALLPAPTEEVSTGPMPPAGEIALLRLMSHDDVGLVIGDSSWLTFSIPTADLAARRFEASRASVFIG